ncbi:MAG: hypothetical protein MUF21_10910 [Gemmatimonadaceae bacterium]|nr:hypothetical protein [Gemmatimonadaceae bacterium]
MRWRIGRSTPFTVSTKRRYSDPALRELRPAPITTSLRSPYVNASSPASDAPPKLVRDSVHWSVAKSKKSLRASGWSHPPRIAKRADGIPTR